jgi:hypothetical protein
MSPKRHNWQVIRDAVAATLVVAGLATIVFGDLWVGVAAIVLGAVAAFSAAQRSAQRPRGLRS